MTQRYTLLIGLASIFHLSQAQTVLTVAEYASLKAHEELPEGAIFITGGSAPADAPASWLLARGGGGGCGCWIEPDGDYTVAMPENDDLSSAAITIPFTFTLFGGAYTTLYINNNGNVSFEQPWGTYTADGFPSEDFFMVAPFWGDVDTRDTTGADTSDFLNGQVLYKVTDHALYVNWVEVGYYAMHDSLRNSFQLIITDGTDPIIPGGNNVSFCYGDMQWTTGDASGGIDGFGGSSATVGVNRGNGIDHAQVGRFSSEGGTYNGAYTDSSGVDWLDSTHFYMNTTGTGVPPIFGSTFDCDTVIVEMPEGPEVRDGGLYRLIVLPGAPDELVSCTSVAPTLPNFVNIDAGPEPYLELLFPIDPEGAELGYHYITFTATNNDPEPLSSTYVLQVEKVDASTHLTESQGIDGFQLMPNPAVESSFLTWPAATSVQLVELVATDGRTVASFRPSTRDPRILLDLKELPSGSYLVRAFTPSGVWTDRLIKSPR